MKLSNRFQHVRGKSGLRLANRLIGVAFVPLFAGQSLIFATGFHWLPGYVAWIGLALMQLSFCMAVASAVVAKFAFRAALDHLGRRFIKS